MKISLPPITIPPRKLCLSTLAGFLIVASGSALSKNMFVMRTNVSIAFGLLGVSILFLGLGQGSAPMRISLLRRIRPVHLLSLLVSTLGLTTVLEYLREKPSLISQFLLVDSMESKFLGPLSPACGAVLVLFGLALILCDLGSKRLSQATEVIAVLISLLFGEIFLSILMGMAPPSGIVVPIEYIFPAFLMVCASAAGILMLSSEGGLLATLLSPGPSGMTARRMLGATILISPIVAWAELEGRSRGLFAEDLGTWIRTLGNLLLSTGMILHTAIIIQREDQRREAANDARAEVERGFARMAEAIPEVVWTAKGNGDIDFLSGRWSEATGLDREDSLRWGWLSAVHPEDLPKSYNRWKESRQTGEPLEMELRLRRVPEGQARWFLVRALCTRDARGKITHWYGTFSDIDDQKRGREKLEQEVAARTLDIRAKQDHFRAILDSAFDAVVVMDPRGQILDWNPMAASIFGWTHDEAVGQLSAEVLFGLATGTQNLVPHSRKESQAARRTGELFPVEIAVSEVKGVDGQPTFTAFVEDITERKRAEEALVKAREAALQGERAKATFLAQMSHEIRTPLNGVIGIAGMLRDTPLEASQLDNVDTIIRSAENLLTIINDLLDFSKIEAGKMEFESIDFALGQLLSDTQKTLFHAARQKDITLEMVVESNVPPAFKGDAGRIRQIILNLVNNAIKFTPKGKVTVRVKLEGQVDQRATLLFEVIDTGVGIPKAAMSRMFQPFSQADSSTSRKFGGTGLGLSISRHLVEQMGGKIGVDSEEGKGSNFWFTVVLPVGVVPKAEAPPIPGATLAPPTKRLRVLVADDNPVNQKIALALLQKIGHFGHAVSNGAEVLDTLRDMPFDLILMDCQMPEVDGYEATRMLRSTKSMPQYHAIPIIAMTANVLEGDREKCLDAGMNDYVTKPISVGSLAKMIEKWTPLAPAQGGENAA